MANNATVSLQIDLKAFNEGLKAALKMGEQWGQAMNGILTGKVKMDTAGLDKALKDYQSRVGKLDGVKVDVDTKSAVNSLQKLTGETEKAEKQTRKSAGSIRDSFAMWGLAIRGAQMAFSGMRRGLDMLTRPALEAEEAQEGLRASLRNTGIYSEELAQKIFESSAALQQITKYEDDAITSGTALMQNIGRISAEQLTQAQKAALGLAAAFRINLETAFELVGKAAAGSTATLGRYGIVLDESLTPAEKFAAVLELGASKFPLAEAAAKTGAGAIEQFKNAWGDMMETVGQTIMPILGGMLKVLKPLVEYFGSLAGGTKALLIVMPLLAAAWYKLVAGGKALALTSGSLVTGFKAATVAVKTFFTTMGTFGGVLMGATVALGAITGAIYAKQRAEEKQIEIQQQLVDRMTETISKGRDEANSTLTLTDRYEKLATKAQRTKKETTEMAGIFKTLKERYPGLIKDTNSMQEALVYMGNAAALARNKLWALAQQDVKRAQLQAKVDTGKARAEAKEAIKSVQNIWNDFAALWPFGKQNKLFGNLMAADMLLDTEDVESLRIVFSTIDKFVGKFSQDQRDRYYNAKMAVLSYLDALQLQKDAEKGIFKAPDLIETPNTGDTGDVPEGGGGTATAGTKAEKAALTALQELEKQFDDFFEKENRGLNRVTERLTVQIDYLARIKKIDNMTDITEEKRKELKKRNERMYAAQITEINKREAEQRKADLSEYYEELQYDDEKYYEWKVKLIETEVRAMDISWEQQNKLIEKRIKALDKEKIAIERLEYSDAVEKYKQFKEEMADTKQIGVARWDAIRDGLIAIREELEAFADNPEVAAILKALNGEIDIAQMNAGRKKGNWFWNALGFDPNSDDDMARVRGIQSTLGMMSTMMSDITNRAMNLNEQRKAAELERIETVAKAQGWSDARLLAEQKKVNAKYEKEAKKLKRIQKMMSLASATINIAEGVTEALSLGPVLGPIMAGMIAALGAVQLKLISEQEFKRGGYTGPGARDQVAGYVHRGEVVFEEPITKRNLPGLMWLRKLMQRGYDLVDLIPGVNLSYAPVPAPTAALGYAGGGYAGDGGLGGLISEVKGLRDDMRNLKMKMDFDKRQVSRMAESGAKARRVIR